ncbi:MAG: transposase [Acidobacteriota bacterium]
MTVRCFQSRPLLRASPALSDRFIGCLAQAMRGRRVSLHAVVVMSNHFHLLVSPDDAGELAALMCHLNTNLSKEIGVSRDGAALSLRGDTTPFP